MCLLHLSCFSDNGILEETVLPTSHLPRNMASTNKPHYTKGCQFKSSVIGTYNLSLNVDLGGSDLQKLNRVGCPTEILYRGKAASFSVS